jgi:DNA-binding transcriptional ArsR family regulator
MAKANKRESADMFKALGDPTRLKIYQFLRGRCWPHAADTSEEQWMVNGPTVSEVSASVTGSKKITSKVSQHLKELRIAGLITIERRGKNMICGVNHAAADSLIALLNCVETVDAVAPQVTEKDEEKTAPAETSAPVKGRAKKHVVVEAQVVEVELVKPRRKSKAASNGGGGAPAQTSSEE